MKTSHALLNIIVGILTIQIALLPVSHALQVQLKTDAKLRTHIDAEMERIGLLKAGTIVEIPDEYAVNGTDGKPNLELTLNNWLRTGGSQQRAADGAGAYGFDGERSDFFFPVRVIKPAKGSTVRTGYQQANHFVALKYLARQGSAFIVSEDTTVDDGAPVAPVPRAEHKAQARPVDPAIQMEADTTCANGLCSQPSDTSEPVRKLISAVSPGLAAATKKSEQVFKRTNNDLREIYSNFQKSCGFELGQFIPIIKSRAVQAGIPSEILLSIMTQESSGRCYVLNSETDKTQSVGLFQINSASGMYPRCTNTQKNILRELGSANRLATGPRCLENPLVNLDESIRILTSTRNLLARNGFEQNQISSEDFWRMTVSGYNGGPRWVLEAKKNLEQFNRQHGTSLSANNWEDLRIFYLREWLSRDQKAAAFANTYQGRSRQNSISNLAYAENVIGRPATAENRPSLTVAWRPTVKD